MPINVKSEEWQKVLKCRDYIKTTKNKLENLNIEQDSDIWSDEIEACLVQITNVCDCRYEYAFTRSITELIGKFGDSIKKNLEYFLETRIEDLKGEQNTGVNETRDIAFSAYYGLSILFKDDYEFKFLNDLVEQYSKYFDDYLLSFEILARLEKRKVKVGEKARNARILKSALAYDSQAIKLIAERFSVRNSGVEISYVSTICRMLEMKIDVPKEIIEKACGYAEFAIDQYGDYAKYYYSYGKLCVALAELSDDIKVIEEYIGHAKSNFGKAISHENHKFYHDNNRIIKYNAEQNYAEVFLIKKRLELELEAVKKNVEFFDGKHEKTEKYVNEEIKKNKKQTIELLAIFTAILQIIIGVINFTSSQTNLIALIITIIVLNCSTLGVYAAYLKLTAEKNAETSRRSGDALLLIAIILIVCIFVAYKYF